MKHLKGILTAGMLIFALCACGGNKTAQSGDGASAKPHSAEEVSVDDVIAANSISGMLENYDSVSITMENIGTGETYAMYYDYEMKYIDFGTEKAGLLSSDYAVVCMNDVYVGEVAATEVDHSYFDLELLTEDDKDDVKEIKEEDGKLMLVAEYSTEDDGAPVDYTKDYLVTTYVLDPVTLVMLEGEDKMVKADGTEEIIYTAKVEANPARSEGAEEMYTHLTSKDTYNVTVVLDPGTANEKTVTVPIAKTDDFSPSVPDGYVVYTDEACTAEYGYDAEKGKDITLYSKAE